MLLTTPKIQRLNYQLVRVIIALKYKLKKWQETFKKTGLTGISGTPDYTTPFHLTCLLKLELKKRFIQSNIICS